jgi:hypothetical protein
VIYEKITSQLAFENDQTERCHVFDRLRDRQSVDWPWKRVPRLARLSLAFKFPQRPWSYALVHPKPRPSQRSLEFTVESERHHPPSVPEHGRRGQSYLSTPSLTVAPRQLHREAVKLPQARAEALPHQRAGSPSPNFGRPPPRVDRAIG